MTASIIRGVDNGALIIFCVLVAVVFGCVSVAWAKERRRRRRIERRLADRFAGRDALPVPEDDGPHEWRRGGW